MVLTDKLLCFFIYKLLRLKISDKTYNAIFQFIKFGIVGVSNVAISYIIYIGSLLLFQKMSILANVDYLVAQVISFILSVLWSFYWNRRMVFNEDNENVPWLQALIKTYMTYAFSELFLSTFLLYIWVEIFKVPKFLAPFFCLVVSVPINFVLNKYWAFRGKPRKGKENIINE